MGNRPKDVSEIRRIPSVSESLRAAVSSAGVEARLSAESPASSTSERTNGQALERPAVSADRERLRAGHDERTAEPAPSQVSRGKEASLRVMVIEDDPDQQWRLARCLTVRGHRVVGTSSLEGAIALSQGWKVDLVLIAEEVAGGAGLDVVRHLRRSLSGVGLILMSSRSDVAFQREAAGEGILAMLRKPVNPTALADTLSALGHLRKRQSVREVRRETKAGKQLRVDRLRATSVAMG